MFNGFTPAAGDFLWELAFNNERVWFNEHKEQFEQTVNEPFKALAAETQALMCSRFPEMDCRLHVSRIYRDARRRIQADRRGIQAPQGARQRSARPLV